MTRKYAKRRSTIVRVVGGVAELNVDFNGQGFIVDLFKRRRRWRWVVQRDAYGNPKPFASGDCTFFRTALDVAMLAIMNEVSRVASTPAR